MDSEKVGKLEEELKELLRKRTVTTGELESFARSIGRRKPSKSQVRGKEPNWISDEFPEARPISIPFHGRNRDVPKGTARSILYDFEEDVIKLRLKYSKSKDNERNDDIQEYEGYEN